MQLAPAPVQPQPLIRIFSTPALDHRGNRLHRPSHIELARAVAYRIYFLSQFGAKAMSGQTDDPHPVDRTFDLAQEPRQHRIGSGLAAEEVNLNAVSKVLI